MKNLVLILFFSLSLICRAQVNLVQNGNFYDFINCPSQADQFNLARYWFSYNCTPEYFHSCSSSSVNAPNTLVGFQNGVNENSFAGICLYYSAPPNVKNYREYIQTKFIQPLEKDKTYCSYFYVNLADLTSAGIDKIGAYFSTDTLNPLVSHGLIDKIPHISNVVGNIIKDTINWIQISGKYTAKGDEQYFIIGNFFSDENTLFEITDTSVLNSIIAYYFIDDVSVYECEEDVLPNSITLPNAFTPNTDGINDIFRMQGQNIKTLNGKILNRWGQELFNWSDVSSGWDGKFKGKYVPEGTYFYAITAVFEDGETKSYTGSILLIR